MSCIKCGNANGYNDPGKKCYNCDYIVPRKCEDCEYVVIWGDLKTIMSCELTQSIVMGGPPMCPPNLAHLLYEYDVTKDNLREMEELCDLEED